MNKIFIIFAILFAIFSCNTTTAIDKAGPIDVDALSSRYEPALSRMTMHGRFLIEENQLQFNWPSSGFSFAFKGSSAAVEFSGYSELYYDIFIDNEFYSVLKQESGKTKYLLCENLPFTEHLVSLRRRTEAFSGISKVNAIYLEEAGEMLPPPSPKEKLIIAVGDSISCGYGVEVDDKDIKFELATENSNKTYAAFAAAELDADYSIVAESGRGMLRNLDNSTNRTLPKLYPIAVPSQANNGGSSSWDYSQESPDLIVITLGTNDFGPGVPNEADFTDTYIKFIKDLLNYHSNSTPEFILVSGPLQSDTWPLDENGNSIRALSTLRGYLEKIKETLKVENGITVHTFNLSQVDPNKGFGADWHTNEWQQKKNGMELAAFIRDTFNW